VDDAGDDADDAETEDMGWSASISYIESRPVPTEPATSDEDDDEDNDEDDAAEEADDGEEEDVSDDNEGDDDEAAVDEGEETELEDDDEDAEDEGMLIGPGEGAEGGVRGGEGGGVEYSGNTDTGEPEGDKEEREEVEAECAPPCARDLRGVLNTGGVHCSFVGSNVGPVFLLVLAALLLLLVVVVSLFSNTCAYCSRIFVVMGMMMC
jgi:hypothetical protein